MKNTAALLKIVLSMAALAICLGQSACSLTRPKPEQQLEVIPVKPDSMSFQQGQAAPGPQPGPNMQQTQLAPPSPAPHGQSMPQATALQAAANWNDPTTIQRTSAEMPVEHAQATQNYPPQPTAPMSNVGYAAPRGIPMPPCGPNCATPNAICGHGKHWGTCQACNEACRAAPGLAGLAAAPCWPEDEYLYDGGDRNVHVKVDGEFGVHGLDIEDTVGHYDTLEGERIVTPSNRVCIYAPRFAAVRKVSGARQQVVGTNIAGMDANLKLNNQQRNGTPAGVVQPLALRGQDGGKNANALQEDQHLLKLYNHKRLMDFREEYAAYENLSVIRLGIYEQGEKARLAASLQSAVTWTENQAVQIMIDGLKASEAAHGVSPQEVVWADIYGKPRLRVIKVASTGAAKPGDIVEFTLRFDNIGNQKMGNVTIIDNLTPRLEYVEDSAQCSIDAKFLTQPNERDSLILRWEITDPLEIGKGGVCRFKCRVR